MAADEGARLVDAPQARQVRRYSHVFKRIAIDHEHVGGHARTELADVVFPADDLGATASRASIACTGVKPTSTIISSSYATSDCELNA